MLIHVLKLLVAQMVVAVTVVKLESAVALAAMTDVAVKKITVAAKKTLVIEIFLILFYYA